MREVGHMSEFYSLKLLHCKWSEEQDSLRETKFCNITCDQKLFDGPR